MPPLWVAKKCQEEVHTWGRVNGETFEATKERVHVLSRADPAGREFLMLGVNFDAKLTMGLEVDELVKECSWGITQLLRAWGLL